ncbi:response regulator [Thiohalomonas denitrificans]|uniref:Response regulator receiver domain-containing protein n=1 Tax=Thiohalomonas denitrificans TaxID=415747 RepID=A0A1G5Q2C5_9GAMM|nr:response regulator [Thiohalomonas denitrificans]SCZ55696.1 Response regulator receiver domain-containing protein [Thiohalomonas denitrificans]
MSEAVGEKILVVDDAPQNVKLLRLILKDAGYRVVEAFSGPEAMDKLRAENPAAMILDVRMPGMSGYEVSRAVRADSEFATLPVIMVTALSMPEERIKGIESGATDFITKPFDKKELLARLHSSLSLVKAESRGSLDFLEEMVVITDPAWQILGISPTAADALGVTGQESAGSDLQRLLTEREASMPAETSDDGLIDFQMRSVDGRELIGRSNPVSDPREQLCLWVTILREST